MSQPSEHVDALRQAVRFFYDMQKLRIQSALRTSQKTAVLDEKHGEHLKAQSDNLNEMEKRELTNIQRILRRHPMWPWLKAQKGCGPTMSGVLLAEIDINRCNTPSQLWRFAGLAVDSKTGHAERLTKGQKSAYNPWLKAKIVKVLADCMIKANSPWREYYDNYKHRKQNQLVPTCMLCEGKGKYTPKKPYKPKGQEVTEEVQEGPKVCTNCAGTGGPAPWGRGDIHRHQAAMRYMVKMFLLEFWKTWRELEGLPVTEPYAVAVLGRTHGDHGGMGIQEAQI